MGERPAVVVIGNGMVGHRFCEELRRADAERRYRIVAIGEESHSAYDRVHLSDFFGGATALDLRLAPEGWHAENDVLLHLSERVTAIDRGARRVETDRGRSFSYDVAVLATGSSPLVPPIPGRERPGIFVYRTIEDLEAIRDWARTARSGAVIGGGLLGLEAAKALLDMGLETHVVEMAPRLMVRQTDAAVEPSRSSRRVSATKVANRSK